MKKTELRYCILYSVLCSNSIFYSIFYPKFFSIFYCMFYCTLCSIFYFIFYPMFYFFHFHISFYVNSILHFILNYILYPVQNSILCASSIFYSILFFLIPNLFPYPIVVSAYSIFCSIFHFVFIPHSITYRFYSIFYGRTACSSSGTVRPMPRSVHTKIRNKRVFFNRFNVCLIFNSKESPRPSPLIRVVGR